MDKIPLFWIQKYHTFLEVFFLRVLDAQFFLGETNGYYQLLD
jgi:hypothetical protein